MQPNSNNTIFSAQRGPSGLRILSVLMCLLALAALFLGFDLLKIMSDEEGQIVMAFGGVVLALAAGVWVLGGILKPKWMSWIEVSPEGLTRVYPHVPTLRVARERIGRLVLYSRTIEVQNQYGETEETLGRCELFVEGTMDVNQAAIAQMGRQMTFENALKTNAIAVGSQQRMSELGAQVAEALGVPFDPAPKAPPVSHAQVRQLIPSHG